MVEHLYIYCIRDLPSNWHCIIEKEHVRESATVLPALESLFLEQPPPFESKSVEKAIFKFIAARRLSTHPVTVSFWTQDMRSSTVLRRV